jgi:hypothetical protein
VIPAGRADPLVQLDLEERLHSAKREGASRRIDELQSAARSHARVRIGAIKDARTEETRRLRADVFVIKSSPQAGVSGRLRDLS